MTHITGKRHGRVLVMATLFMAASIGWGCSKDPPKMTTGSPDAAGNSSGVDLAVGGSDVLPDSRPDIPPDTQPTPPANVQFPDPPQVTCSTASDCDFPPSACADPGCDAAGCPGSSWVVYYDNPQCSAGKCVFEQRYFQCSGSYLCNNGGCRFNGTAVAAP